MILQLRSVYDPVGPKTLVLGIGSGGIAAVDLIKKDDYPCASWVAIGSEEKEVNKYTTMYRLLIDKNDSKDPAYCEAVAKEHSEELKALISKFSMVVLVTGLGGCVGSGVTPVIASLCKELNITTFAVVSTPMGIDGELSQAIAQASLIKLPDEVMAMKVLEGDKCIRLELDGLRRERYFEVINANVRFATEMVLISSEKEEYENLDSEEARQSLTKEVMYHFDRMDSM